MPLDGDVDVWIADGIEVSCPYSCNLVADVGDGTFSSAEPPCLILVVLPAEDTSIVVVVSMVETGPLLSTAVLSTTVLDGMGRESPTPPLPPSNTEERKSNPPSNILPNIED
jgi:hypothetical protein